MNLSLIKIFWIILVSVLISFAFNHFSPNGLNIIRAERNLNWEADIPISNPEQSIEPSGPNDQTTNTETTEKISEEKFEQPKAIKLEFAYRLFNQKIKFIDARSPEEFAEGHIKDAINIPFYGSENYQHILDKISKDEILVTYCSGDDCDLSVLLGDELFEKGYKKVYVFFGGWSQWIEKNYPISKN